MLRYSQITKLENHLTVTYPLKLSIIKKNCLTYQNFGSGQKCLMRKRVQKF